MISLIKYFLLLFMSCTPAFDSPVSKTTGQKINSSYKDNASESDDTEILDEESNNRNKKREDMQVENDDLLFDNTIQWKFKKHMILGN